MDVVILVKTKTLKTNMFGLLHIQEKSKNLIKFENINKDDNIQRNLWTKGPSGQ